MSTFFKNSIEALPFSSRELRCIDCPLLSYLLRAAGRFVAFETNIVKTIHRPKKKPTSSFFVVRLGFVKALAVCSTSSRRADEIKCYKFSMFVARNS